MAQQKNLRLYVEFPSAVPDLTFGDPKPTEWERVVASSDFFAPELEKDRILALHGCWFLPVERAHQQAHLVVARVAGYDKAVYGLPEAASPILLELQPYHVLVATSKLSHFITGRYGPTEAWSAIWNRLIRWLDPDCESESLRWESDVRIRSGQYDKLDSDAEAEAFRRSVQWFRDYTLFTAWGGKKGVIEGYESKIDHNGKQLPLTTARADCISETAMVFAYEWVLCQNPASRRTASDILDFVWSSPDFVQNDSASPAYGLVNWYQRGPIFYGDDNARVVLSSMAAGRLLGNDKWDEKVLRCLLANLRTSSPEGFRPNWLGYPDSFSNGRGWQYYRDTPFVRIAPHYQAYLWACNLWAYALTGFDGFLTPTKKAIRMTMEAYPHGWRWTNGLTQEIARMILPLAFLLRIEDTPEHRSWLDSMCSELLKQMQPCGAIAERIGPLENGSYPPPQSNEAYGTREASLLQANGDPVCDLLYTTNFAFLGLHEAAAATGDARLLEAENRMADFLCRIQVNSSKHPYLNGAWMRSFDYNRWEYWGSSADAGWAAWCAETGWTNTWISSVFAMRQQGDQLFDLSASERWKSLMQRLLKEMEVM
ncbi:hypothetical protein ACFQI7_30355 [Paenibacillus allorhizosphaerae]|uniref:Alpha-L-rhamnosidase six-hairpin glycosidase domain-containing protein n=1 Tax=Paenibacillus allorhizosphaerae TaxID=2849866 RepID=A0ABN7TJU4_9BACL|nr:hypothetical protein [Paenibacillus allorhizosphaerae]CAG7640488.1 hypothetical protein PAECIP111802_02653 [Paenibacillus allorhizosphaerae]